MWIATAADDAQPARALELAREALIESGGGGYRGNLDIALTVVLPQLVACGRHGTAAVVLGALEVHPVGIEERLATVAAAEAAVSAVLGAKLEQLRAEGRSLALAAIAALVAADIDEVLSGGDGSPPAGRRFGSLEHAQ